MPIIRGVAKPILVEQEALEHLSTVGLDGLGLYVLILADEDAQRNGKASILPSLVGQTGMSNGVITFLLCRLAKAGLIQVTDDGSPLWRQEVQQDIARINEPVPRRYKEHDPGFVYVIDGGLYHKIGKSRDPSKRIKQLQCFSSSRLTFAHLISTDRMTWTEDLLHSRFHKCRSHGEWFSLSPDDIAWIKQKFPASEK